MAGIRELLAIGLGVALGLAAIAYPDAVLRLQTAGTRPDRRNEYGQGSGTTSNRARRFVQLLGVLALVIAVVVALQAFQII